MTKTGYTRKDLDRYYQDGIRSGAKQGKRDTLAKFRVFLTQEEQRIERT